MKKTYCIAALAALVCISGCLSLKSEKFEYEPPIEIWVFAFETGGLSREELVLLIKGSLEIKEMEGIKIVSYYRTYGRDQYRTMKKLAEETRRKVDMKLEGRYGE